MIGRKIYVGLLAVAVPALIGIAAGNANAAEEFHCEVEPCRYTLVTDGVGTTAHHVFLIKNAVGESLSFTCESLRGEARTETKTSPLLTFTSLALDNCKSVLGSMTADFNGCDMRLLAQNGGKDEAHVTIVCPTGHEIEFTNQTCTVGWGPQTFKGVGYHNVVGGGGDEEITLTINANGLLPVARGECGIDLTKTPLTGSYTTGNTLITAETDNAGADMVSAWWK